MCRRHAEPRDQPDQHGAATVANRRRRHRRAVPSADADAARQRRTAADFFPALVGVAIISLLSVPFFLRMAPDAGAEVSGRPVAR